MATKYPRTPITLPPAIKQVYKETAEVMGIPTSRLMAQMLTESAPAVVQLKNILQLENDAALEGLSKMAKGARDIADDAQVDIEELIAQKGLNQGAA